MRETVEAFAALVDAAGQAARLTAHARAIPNVHASPEAAAALAQLELERAAALANVAAFAVQNAGALLPGLTPDDAAPHDARVHADGGDLFFTLAPPPAPPPLPPAPPLTGPNQFLDFLGPAASRYRIEDFG